MSLKYRKQNYLGITKIIVGVYAVNKSNSDELSSQYKIPPKSFDVNNF